MTAPALKVDKVEHLKAKAQEQWQLLGKSLLSEQQAGVHARMHRQELGSCLIKLRKELECQGWLKPLPSTGGRPRSAWWVWFEEWQPQERRGSITRDEALRAMSIAGDPDPGAADEAYKDRRRKRQKRRRLSRASEDVEARESPKPISLVVRRVEGMIRKMSIEDREALFARIGDLIHG